MALEREPQRNPEIPARPHEHSVGMSKRLLMDDRGLVYITVDPSFMEAFKVGSQENRAEYWRGKGTYGEQMKQWLDDTSSWIDAQGKDTKLGEILQTVGIGNTDANFTDLRTKGKITNLVAKINTSLKPDERLDVAQLGERQLRVLDFYNEYLDKNAIPQQEETDTKRLVKDLGEALKRKNGKLYPPDEAQGMLEAIAPFLRIVGVDAQHGLGAILAAEVHAVTKKADVERADDKDLNGTDQRALHFFDKYNQTPPGEDNASAGRIPEGTFDAVDDLPADDMPEFPEESEITIPQHLLELYQQVPEFSLDGQVLDEDQKKGLQQLMENIRLSRPLIHTIMLDEEFVDKQLEHHLPFFAHHQDIVPAVYLLVNRHATDKQNPDQNPTLNKGESIFEGQQNFFTGLAALMGGEIKDSKLRTETQASAAIVLADAILQIYRQGGPNWLKVLVETQMEDFRNQWSFIGHDVERRLGGGDDNEIETQVRVLEKTIQELKDGEEIPQPDNPKDALFAIIKRTPTQENPYPLEIDIGKTVERLWERVKDAFDTTFEGKLTPQDAMLVEFLGNGLYVTKLAEAIAEKQRKEQQAA